MNNNNNNINKTSSNKIDIGLVEPLPVDKKWKMKCKYFPSKLGGHPSFLVLDPIPDSKQLTCLKCGHVMRFIMQAYVPIETMPSTFHRTLYMFGCGRTAQCSAGIRIFRCQLSRVNRFYSIDPPDYDNGGDCDDKNDDPNPQKFNIRLCHVCGIRGPHRCGSCQKTSYCSKEHQIIDWKYGGHKELCSGCEKEESNNNNNNQNYGRLVFQGIVYNILIVEYFKFYLYLSIKNKFLLWLMILIQMIILVIKIIILLMMIMRIKKFLNLK